MAMRFMADFRFSPRDEELVDNYLCKKVMGEPYCDDGVIQELVIYGKHTPSPSDLFASLRLCKKSDQLCFFTKLINKSDNGGRYDRRSGAGTWVQQGTVEVKYSRWKALRISFAYKDDLKKGSSGWIMQQFTLVGVHESNWAVCKMYWRDNKRNNKKSVIEQESDQESEVFHSMATGFVQKSSKRTYADNNDAHCSDKRQKMVMPQSMSTRDCIVYDQNQSSTSNLCSSSVTAPVFEIPPEKEPCSVSYRQDHNNNILDDFVGMVDDDNVKFSLKELLGKCGEDNNTVGEPCIEYSTHDKDNLMLNDNNGCSEFGSQGTSTDQISSQQKSGDLGLWLDDLPNMPQFDQSQAEELFGKDLQIFLKSLDNICDIR